VLLFSLCFMRVGFLLSAFNFPQVLNSCLSLRLCFVFDSGGDPMGESQLPAPWPLSVLVVSRPLSL